MAMVLAYTADYRDRKLLTSQGGYYNGYISISSGHARTGTYSYYTSTNGNASWYIILDNSLSEFYMAFGFYRVSSNNTLLQFYDSAGGAQLALKVDTYGYIEARRTSKSGTLLDTSSQTVPLYAWQHIQVHIKIDNSSGVVQIKQNGVQTMDFTGDTQNTANADMQRFHPCLSQSAVKGYWDDIVLFDTSGSYNTGWPGQLSLYPLFPNGAGDNTDLTPSAGNNYECVDDNPPDEDTSYVESDTDDHYDLYEIEGLPESGEIKAVQAVAKAKLAESGSGSIALGIKAGSTSDFGDDQALDASYEILTEIWEENPDDSAVFEEADITSLQIGQKVRP